MKATELRPGSKSSDSRSGRVDGSWLETLTGQRIRIRTHGRDTNNAITVIEYVERPHSRPPIFTRHEFVEVFCVVEGTLTFQFLDESVFLAPAGSVVTAPSWKPHSFWNAGDEPTRVLLACSPAGLERFFEESHALLQRLPPASSRGAELKAKMKQLRDKYGLEHVGQPPAA